MPSSRALWFIVGDEHREAARIGAAERVRGAVLGRHQRQVQQLAARQRGADPEPRAAALLGVDVVVGDRDQSRRAAGSASVTTSAVISLVIEAIGSTACGVLGEQHLVGVLVEHQGDARLQLERIDVVVQAGELAERRTDRLDPDQRDPAQGAVAAANHDHGGLLAPAWPRPWPGWSWRRDASFPERSTWAPRPSRRRRGREAARRKPGCGRSTKLFPRVRAAREV